MEPILEVVAHPTGPWLVKAGGVQYAVPPLLGRALRPLAGKRPSAVEMRECLGWDRSAEEFETWIAEMDLALTPGEAGGRSRPIRFRLPLLPASRVRRLARRLRPLTGTGVLAALGLTGAAGYLAAPAGTGPTGFSPDLGSVVVGLGLFLVTAIWHELGHAAALSRSGYPPGGIGAGVLFVIPVLYADVSAVQLLPRSGRLRVDVAGVAFQLAPGGSMMALASWPGLPPFWTSALLVAGSSVLLAVTWSMFPFVRSDGYWSLCDLLGLASLDRTPRGPVSAGLRVFLILYQLAHAGFLLVMGLYFPWRMILLALGLLHQAGMALRPVAAGWLAWGLYLAILAALGSGLARRIGYLVRAARSGLLDLRKSR